MRCRATIKLIIVFVCIISLFSSPTLAGKKRKARESSASAKEIIWPPPPNTPIIKFIGGYYGSANFPPAKKARMRQRLLGEKQKEVWLKKPFAVCADDERIYVSDYSSVAVFDIVNKEFLEIRGEPPFTIQRPMGLTLDLDGKLYVADSIARRVVVFDKTLKPISIIGKLDDFKNPVGIGVNNELNRVYISDTGKNCVRVFSKEGKHLFDFGSLGTREGEFYNPTHLWVDKEGLVYITDFFNFRVQVFDSDGNYLFKIGSLGTGLGQFSKPKGVAVDSEGHIYVVDASYSNVQIFDREGNILLYFCDFGWRDGELRLPNGIFIDRKDKIYVVDAVNRRVCVFQFLGTPDVSPKSD